MNDSHDTDGNGQEPAAQDSTASFVSSPHPIPLGTNVAVFRHAQPAGPIYLEGRAVIVGVTKISDVYQVRFVNERRVCRRLVLPEIQSDPEGIANAFSKIWQHYDLSPLLEDFFPPEVEDREDDAP